jgi:hypothetical protein
LPRKIRKVKCYRQTAAFIPLPRTVTFSSTVKQGGTAALRYADPPPESEALAGAGRPSGSPDHPADIGTVIRQLLKNPYKPARALRPGYTLPG